MIKLYKAFIASPSDTTCEREICEKVFDEINSSLGTIYNFRIESVKWEKDVRPTLKNKDGQSEIFDQVGDDFKIFIGIMNQKFGSPTPRAGSGTEEEFDSALERFKEKKDIELIFYFNDEPPKSKSEINIEEFVKINNFKKRIEPLGIYGTYVGCIDFEEKLRKNLSKYFIGEFESESKKTLNTEELINKESLRKVLKKRFNDSLKGFDGQPKIWIEPVISRTSEISQNPDENFNQRVLIEEIIHTDKSYIVNAPSQFGLTTLAHYLILEAWENNQLWIYIDNSSVKAHNIHNSVKNEVNSLEQNLADVKCIIFDSFVAKDRVSVKKLKKLIEANPNTKLVVLNTVDDSLYLDKEDFEAEEGENLQIQREFIGLHLIALPRNQIRKLVKEYNNEQKFGEEISLLDKVTNELECLNLHRTPYNILTILKVSEKFYDDSPVNRTRMIEMILFVLFDLGEIPRYKTKPDLKDCEYILGRYCESMLRNEKYTFNKVDFLLELNKYCEEKKLALDVEVVFEILNNNNIIIFDYDNYRFKSSFWVYYFGAKRMHVSEDFKQYMFKSKKYLAYPEIIEFYTGIDRNRDDALEILLEDIIATRNSVDEKLGIKGEINPLGSFTWKPEENEIEKIQNEIGENVLTSKLPIEVKDQYLDKSYNQIKPYNQSIKKLFEEYSLHNLMQQIRASSTALRNSDYADVEIRKKLLKEIYLSWHELSKVLFAISPIIASNGSASFEGAEFELMGDFGATFEERLNRILQVIPTNVVGYFKDELYSPKIAPLLYDNFTQETNELLKHEQALILVFKRPEGWKEYIEKYIISINKNSYYLKHIINSLRAKYRFDFATDKELSEIKYLVKVGIAKHEFGIKKPSLNQIVQISDKNLPKREQIND